MVRGSAAATFLAHSGSQSSLESEFYSLGMQMHLTENDVLEDKNQKIHPLKRTVDEGMLLRHPTHTQKMNQSLGHQYLFK